MSRKRERARARAHTHTHTHVRGKHGTSSYYYIYVLILVNIVLLLLHPCALVLVFVCLIYRSDLATSYLTHSLLIPDTLTTTDYTVLTKDLPAGQISGTKISKFRYYNI